MIVAIDVYYREDEANAAAICFKDWESEEIIATESCIVKNLFPYVSGQFYKRELPCILYVLELCRQEVIEAIIIDGYVVLDNEGKLGLGGYLYQTLEERIPIIGVAKRAFIKNIDQLIKLERGKSRNPLFITSLGMDLQEAATKIENMKGEYRIPTLLKLVDQESRK